MMPNVRQSELGVRWFMGMTDIREKIEYGEKSLWL